VDGTAAVSDGDCGAQTAGYIYNSANGASTCAAAACSMATQADFDACCKKPTPTPTPTSVGTCAASDCSSGFILKTPTPMCAGVECSQTECCNTAPNAPSSSPASTTSITINTLFSDITSCGEWSGQIRKSRNLAFGCAMDLCVKQQTELIPGALVTSTLANCRRQVNVVFTATVTAQFAPAALEASKTINVVTLAVTINTVIDALGLNSTLLYLNSSSITYVGLPVVLVSTIASEPESNNTVLIAVCVAGGIVLVVVMAVYIWIWGRCPDVSNSAAADMELTPKCTQSYNHAVPTQSRVQQRSCC